jgi:hypothetical protein
MASAHEEHGFEVRIYTKDHPPPHIHVWKAGGQVKITLDEEPVVQRVKGMSDRDVVKAYRIVARNRAQLLAKWREIHG